MPGDVGTAAQALRARLRAAVAARGVPLATMLVSVTLARPALTVGKGAVSLLATLGTIFALLVLFLLEGPKMRRWLLELMPPEKAAYCTRVAAEISQSATGYAFGNLLTSLIAGLVVFVTLAVLGVPFPLLWAVWVALVDFLPMIGGALAGIPTVLFAIPVAGALQVIARELWQITVAPRPPDGEQAADPEPPVGNQERSETHRDPHARPRSAPAYSADQYHESHHRFYRRHVAVWTDQ